MVEWTTDDIPDLSGRTAVVTGANTGLGFETTRALADKGAHVIMACRSRDRGEAARQRLLEADPAGDLDVRRLDLADLSSVRSFAETIDTDLDLLCNNAGVMAIPRRETTDGFEYQFGVNHLGHFALTGQLLDPLTRGEGARVVTQSSGIHERGRIDFDDLHGRDSYDKWGAYAQSKLANVLFAYELERRLAAAGVESTASLACHPGWAATDLQRRGPEAAGSPLRRWAVQAANALFAQSARRGALPMLYAATAAAVDGGEYIGPDGVLNMRGPPAKQRSSARSYDEALAERLWAVSEELTGVTYDLAALD